uniref:RNA-directed DNA polymerase, eukaryota n=1 Tax=Tanacetum cinerariifolium TaxID=118510 RepID=A0A699GRU9_TANCI|nr:RNA-directed DNA polymerase, eukaryota [Tanacetum cinerariifolium]
MTKCRVGFGFVGNSYIKFDEIGMHRVLGSCDLLGEEGDYVSASVVAASWESIPPSIMHQFTDVYIAWKLYKAGRRFAFVRFLKIKNNESLISDLNKIWIGSYHLYAALARFEKKPPTPPNSNPKPPSQKNLNHSHAHANPNRSYANALNGIESTHHPSQVKTILKSVTLDESDLIDTSDTKTAILAKVRDI